MTDRVLKVAVIPGDGIGPEVTEAAMPLLARAVELDGARLQVTELDWGGERLLRTGAAMPGDATDLARAHDAVLFGAVGHPDLAPDVSVWTLVHGAEALRAAVGAAVADGGARTPDLGGTATTTQAAAAIEEALGVAAA